MSTIHNTAAQLADLCTTKNLAYGDSVGKSAELLKLLYPDGLRPDQYLDAIFAARNFDKRARMAQLGPDTFSEDPRLDLGGYALLELHLAYERKEPAPCHNGCANDAEPASTTTVDSANHPSAARSRTTTTASGRRESPTGGILQSASPSTFASTDAPAEAATSAASQSLSASAVRPKVVCLCGSTRFFEAFQLANFAETMAGRIVLSVGFYPHSSGHGEGVGHDSAEKIALDELHKRKIDLCDEVLVLNKDGYIGNSTRSEIEYAIAIGRPVRYLEAIDRA